MTIGIRPEGKSTCTTGKTWTLDEEAADLAKQVEVSQAGGIWMSDGQAPSFLGHMDAEGQRQFIEHLKAGRLRAAIGIVVDGAFRCGVRDSSALVGSRRAKIVVPKEGGMGKVEFLQQRVSPQVGVILSHAIAGKIKRSEVAKILRKGGMVRVGSMASAIPIKALSKRDIDEYLASYPHRSAAGRPRQQR